MKFEDVKIGMKVVPHNKSVWDYSFEEWLKNDFGVAKLFKENGYLFVTGYCEEETAFTLNNNKEDFEDGDFFLAEDFELYEEGSSFAKASIYQREQLPMSYSIHQTTAQPYCCPVCRGNGLVPNGFYGQTSEIWGSDGINREQCKSCQGTGVVWR